MGQIVLYEGNGCSQAIVKTFEDTPGTNTKFEPGDEARSVRLLAVKPGTIITLYDSKDGKLNDDFCVIRVKEFSNDYPVGTFERSYEDVYVSVSYARKNGLDGKVSRIRIDWDGSGSLAFAATYGFSGSKAQRDEHASVAPVDGSSTKREA
jgi:hypothetical protein